MGVGVQAGYEVYFLGEDIGLGSGAGNDLGCKGIQEENLHASGLLRGYHPIDVVLACFYSIHFGTSFVGER